ncbi:VOC family protein [Knoellia sp. 3-2P3]|nr:VOC family protein [Knoellia sp. 3-2P3]MDF2091113.1 VOC family protein [Knoellia sp. 3-2P3]
MTGAPCWVDLFTSDTARAEQFYGELFGWTSEHGDEEKYGGYIMFRKDGKMVGGCMRNEGSSGAPDMWSVYLASDDARRTVERAAELGGSVIVPAMAVPEQGVMAMVTDPSGAAVGVWQGSQSPGIEVVAEPGTPNWFELHTRDYDRTLSFYEDVFGWDTHVMSDTDDFRYTTLGEGDSQQAGVMDAAAMLPENVPGLWGIYWGVKDPDAFVEKAQALGATVLHPAEDTPYGRMATLADPTGAMFRIIRPPQG